MAEVGAYEAKTHLSASLDRVAAGESITITRLGVAVAVLSPPRRPSTMSVQEAIDGIRAFRKDRVATDAEIRSWIEEGRDGCAWSRPEHSDRRHPPRIGQARGPSAATPER